MKVSLKERHYFSFQKWMLSYIHRRVLKLRLARCGGRVRSAVAKLCYRPCRTSDRELQAAHHDNAIYLAPQKTTRRFLAPPPCASDQPIRSVLTQPRWTTARAYMSSSRLLDSLVVPPEQGNGGCNYEYWWKGRYGKMPLPNVRIFQWSRLAFFCGSTVLGAADALHRAHALQERPACTCAHTHTHPSHARVRTHTFVAGTRGSPCSGALHQVPPA